jgi:hypothetical protein
MYIRIRKTGHMYYGSSMESAEGSDNCGTCNGAMCGDDESACMTKYYVDEKIFYSLKEAEEALKQYEEGIKILIPGATQDDGDPEYFIENGELWAEIYIYNFKDPSKESGYKNIKCDPASTKYQEIFENIAEEMKYWNECTIAEKNQHHYQNSCDVHKKCNDERCYYEMKCCGRKTKKWYM